MFHVHPLSATYVNISRVKVIVKHVIVQTGKESISQDPIWHDTKYAEKLTIACSILLSMATTLAPDALWREEEEV